MLTCTYCVHTIPQHTTTCMVLVAPYTTVPLCVDTSVRIIYILCMIPVLSCGNIPQLLSVVVASSKWL